MGRSVSYPHNATVVTYKPIEVEPYEDIDEDGETVTVEPSEFDYQDAFDSMVEDLQEYAPTLWPSLRKCDKWLDREDHALLENDLCYIGISEYCGLVALWIVPKTDEYAGYYSDAHVANLCDRWVDQIRDKFIKTFGAYHKVATASNGESFYRKNAEAA